MPDAFSLFWGAVSSAGVILARFVRLIQVGKSVGHHLVSPADLPTKAT